MSVSLPMMLKCVAAFLTGLAMAAVSVFADAASISALLGAGFLFIFSASMRTSEQLPE